MIVLCVLSLGYLFFMKPIKVINDLVYFLYFNLKSYFLEAHLTIARGASNHISRRT